VSRYAPITASRRPAGIERQRRNLADVALAKFLVKHHQAGRVSATASKAGIALGEQQLQKAGIPVVLAQALTPKTFTPHAFSIAAAPFSTDSRGSIRDGVTYPDACRGARDPESAEGAAPTLARDRERADQGRETRFAVRVPPRRALHLGLGPGTRAA
jgi:hypothetical protein